MSFNAHNQNRNHHQQQQENNNQQDVESQVREDEDSYYTQDSQSQQEPQQNIQIQPLSESQMKEEISLFFNLYINPLLIFGSLTALVFENNQQIYYNTLIEQSYVILSLFFYAFIAISYFYSFVQALKQSQFQWRTLRVVNYFGLFSIGFLVSLYTINSVLQKRYFDLRWSRMMLTLLILSQYSYFTIIRLYGELDISLSSIFNKIYFLIIPLSDSEKINSFASLTEIYANLKVVSQPLALIYYFIQIIYNMKMYKWAPPIVFYPQPTLEHEYRVDEYIWIALDQQRTIQMFTIFVIFGLILIRCSEYLGISDEHKNRLPFILVFLYYTTYIMTYKFYLSAQILSGGWANIEKLLMPIFIITVIPLFSTIFMKRALTKLYRLRSGDQEQLQYQQVQLFSAYRLDVPINNNSPNYVQQIQEKQESIYSMINTEQFGVAAILFFYQFVNLNQLFAREQQDTIGLQIQGIYDCVVDITIYIFIIHTIVYQALKQMSQALFYRTEYGIFSFLFIANYILKLSWNMIYMITMFILTSYIMNLTEQNTAFHIGPGISVLWMLLIYSIKQGVVPNLVYEYVRYVKVQSHLGQLQQRIQWIQQNNNINDNNQQNPQINNLLNSLNINPQIPQANNLQDIQPAPQNIQIRNL